MFEIRHLPDKLTAALNLLVR